MPFPKKGGVQGEEEFGKRQAAQGLGDDGRRGAMGLNTLVARKAPEPPLPAPGLQGLVDGMGDPAVRETLMLWISPVSMFAKHLA